MTNHLKYVSFEFLWNVYELRSIMTSNFRQRDVLSEKFFHFIHVNDLSFYVLNKNCQLDLGQTQPSMFRPPNYTNGWNFFLSISWYASDPGCAMLMECKLLRQAFNVWAGHLIYFVVVNALKCFGCVRIWIFSIFFHLFRVFKRVHVIFFLAPIEFRFFFLLSLEY